MGVDAVLVEVEVDMALGLPFFNVVGLPEGAAKESKVRVVSALKNAGFVLPQKRVTVNLAPADLRKEGATFELPIALGVLAAAGQLDPSAIEPWLFGGELALDGMLKPIRGVLPLALAARNGKFKGVIVPVENAGEAGLVDRIDVIPVRTLKEAVDHLTGDVPVKPFDRTVPIAAASPSGAALDMSEVRGQNEVKDAMELAAAGGHNVLLCGPPGSGKTMLARRLPGILPPLRFEEALEVTKVYSVLGLLREGQALVRERPFRAPHHTISDAGLVGGGPLARPGELSMAHRGVLFLDELPEYRRNVLEVLRQPLEEGVVRLARANQHVAYPCEVMLVGAMNPCFCGYFNVPGTRLCSCGDARILQYKSRISGPLLDRFDISIESRPVDVEALAKLELVEKPTEWYRARVEEARARQRHRFRDEARHYTNADMGPTLLRQACVLSDSARKILSFAVKKFGWSARAHDRLLKLARTRADLEGHELITDDDMRMVIGCRVLDRSTWLEQGLSRIAGGQRSLLDVTPATKKSPRPPPSSLQ